MWCEAERAKAGEAAASEHAASELVAPVKPTHKVQGCDSKCDWPCSKCGWEECTIQADHGSSCDVRIFSDGEIEYGPLHSLLLPSHLPSPKTGCMGPEPPRAGSPATTLPRVQAALPPARGLSRNDQPCEHLLQWLILLQ